MQVIDSGCVDSGCERDKPVECRKPRKFTTVAGEAGTGSAPLDRQEDVKDFMPAA